MGQIIRTNTQLFCHLLCRQFPGDIVVDILQKLLRDIQIRSILYNLNDYYDGLQTLLRHMTEMGLSSPERQEGIYFAKDLSEIREIIKNQRSNVTIAPPENTQGMGNHLG